MKLPPRKVYLEEFDKTFYKCQECNYEVDENGDCSENAGPCYYCPDQCSSCGTGFCDQSC